VEGKVLGFLLTFLVKREKKTAFLRHSLAMTLGTHAHVYPISGSVNSLALEEGERRVYVEIDNNMVRVEWFDPERRVSLEDIKRLVYRYRDRVTGDIGSDSFISLPLS
jgi:hypothetical protein